MSAPSTRRVLDAGQCDLDHANITRLLKENFDVAVDRAKSFEQVQYMMGYYDYDLVLVNRVFDAGGAPGLELIAQLKRGAETAQVPVMLVSNHDDAQSAAIELGALRGFGKAALADAATVTLLKSVLCD